MLKITNVFTGAYYSKYNVSVSISPYTIFEDAIRLFPINDRIAASFKGGHNINRWDSVMQECLMFAKFVKTYRCFSSEQLKDYEIIEDVKFFWPSTKNEIIYDRNYHTNNKKAKIIIRTGAESNLGRAYLACEKDVKELIEQMVREIGIYEAQKKCEYWSNFADAR